MGLLIFIHVVACVLLIIIILIQAGRGGGLVESFSNVESMFGPKTNAFLTRTTSIFSILFFITCLSLAFLSARQSRSLIRGSKMQKQADKQIPLQENATQAVSPNQAELPKESAKQEPGKQETVTKQEVPKQETTNQNTQKAQ